MAVIDLTKLVGAMVQTHSSFGVLTKRVDLSVYPLAAGDVLRLFDRPLGSFPMAISAKVRTADSVAAATVDIGLYDADDDVDDADAFLNELTIGVADSEGHRRPILAMGPQTHPQYIGMSQGAGGGGVEFNDAVIDISVAVIDLTMYDSVE